MNHAHISKIMRMTLTGLSHDRCDPEINEHRWRLVQRRPLDNQPGFWVVRFECDQCGSRCWDAFAADMIWQMGLEVPVAEQAPPP